MLHRNKYIRSIQNEVPPMKNLDLTCKCHLKATSSQKAEDWLLLKCSLPNLFRAKHWPHWAADDPWVLEVPSACMQMTTSAEHYCLRAGSRVVLICHVQRTHICYLDGLLWGPILE